MALILISDVGQYSHLFIRVIRHRKDGYRCSQLLSHIPAEVYAIVQVFPVYGSHISLTSHPDVKSIHSGPIVLLDPENVDIAVGIPLPGDYSRSQIRATGVSSITPAVFISDLTWLKFGMLKTDN